MKKDRKISDNPEYHSLKYKGQITDDIYSDFINGDLKDNRIQRK